MGGELHVAPPPPTREEVFARLSEIGREARENGVPNPHTVWVVEDPPASGRFFWVDRSDVDNICYAEPVGHLERYPRSHWEMASRNMVFFPYKYQVEAVAEAVSRLAQVGLRCRFCHGVVHRATACEYTDTFKVCGTCIRPRYYDHTKHLPSIGLAGYLESWTASKPSKKLKARFPEAKGFYECAGKFKE